LVLLVTGIAIGVGVVVFIQERYLPPRLSAADSAQLRQSFDRAERERQRLSNELDATSERLKAAVAEKSTLSTDLASSKQTIERLRAQLGSLVAALPPDPRGGVVQVRSANFSASAGALVYEVLLTRARSGGQPFSGVMQFAVTGNSGRGTETTVTLKPVEISLDTFESLRGSLPLPEGFVPREAMVRVLDRPDGRQFGMRVLPVK
jgi:hypothetical protein